MRFKFKRGNQTYQKYLNLKKYEIDWDAESKSKFQFRCKQFLRQYWDKHLIYEECRVVGTKMHFDFFNATKKIVVECQGVHHNTFNHYFFGGNPNEFLAQLQRDHKKEEFCELNEISFIEIFETDELNEEFAKKIKLI